MVNFRETNILILLIIDKEKTIIRKDIISSQPCENYAKFVLAIQPLVRLCIYHIVPFDESLMRRTARCLREPQKYYETRSV